MSGLPPNDPPPSYAAYPRNSVSYGSADKLQTIAEGYFGLNKIFILNVVLAFGSRMIQTGVSTTSNALMIFAVSILVIGVVIGLTTYPFNKKIGDGCGWVPGMPIFASLLMGVNSALCCGIIGYIVVQAIAGKEMKKYGVKTGFAGVKKKEIEAAVDQLRRSQQAAPPPST